MSRQARHMAGFSTAVLALAIASAGCASDPARPAPPSDAGTAGVPPVGEAGTPPGDDPNRGTVGSGLFTSCADGGAVVFGSSMETGGISPDLPDPAVRSAPPPPA